jgi:hypothetical protein
VFKASGVSAAVALATMGTVGGDLISPVSAQDYGCQATVKSIRDDITDRLSGSIYQIQESQIQDAPISPYNQKGEIHFSLGSYGNSRRGHRSRDIMTSETLLTDYSDRIIKSCGDIVRVTFSMIGSDWIRSYSWIDNKYTRKDECLEPRRGIEYNLAWGQQICL